MNGQGRDTVRGRASGRASLASLAGEPGRAQFIPVSSVGAGVRTRRGFSGLSLFQDNKLSLEHAEFDFLTETRLGCGKMYLWRS